MRIFDIEQGTPEWKQLRQGVITGTRLKGVMGSSTVQKTLLEELIAEDLAPVAEIYQNDAMLRGTMLEPKAREQYEIITGHKVHEIGFCLHETKKYIGLSPDGFIDTVGAEELLFDHAIEIKCMGPKNHLKAIKDNKVPAEYKYQILNYFLVNEKLQTLDLVLYNPDIYLENLQLYIIPVKREEFEIELDVAIKTIEKFKDKWVKELKALTTINQSKENDNKL